MFFFISKVLGFLYNPFIWVLFFLTWSITTKILVRKKRLIIISMCLIYVFGNGVLINEINLVRESKYMTQSNAEINTLDTAILLGGFSFERNNKAVFAESADRFLQALHLYQSEKINTLIISGGSGSLKYPNSKEAKLVGEYMKTSGLRLSNLLLEDSSRNTYENAYYTKQKYGNSNPVLLVTSAFHMYRAKAVFEKAGFKVMPYATHYFANKERNYSLDNFIIPSAKSFYTWELILKEWLGIVVYKVKGYI